MDESAYREVEGRYWTHLGVSPEEHRVHLRRSGVDVRIQEIGSGPPVVFVHGASNAGTSWADLVVRLEGFRCLLVDRPGTGLSGPLPGPFEDVAALARFSDDLVIDILDSVGLASAHIVATSYGGYMALRGAAAYPERIERVVILGWTMGAASPDMPMFMRMGAIPGLARIMTKMPVNERVVRGMFKRIGLKRALETGKISDELISCYTALLKHTDTLKNEVEVGRWLMTLKGLNPDIVLPSEVLSRISAPVYVLWGEDDPFGGPGAARAFADRLPNARLELLPQAGHAVWLDDPEHVAVAITDHLNEGSPDD